jgi:hypothetical protein
MRTPMKVHQHSHLEALAIKALSNDPDWEVALAAWKKAVLLMAGNTPRPSVKRYPNFNRLLDLLTTPATLS